MSKYQCLRCQHLDIEFPDKAVCTRSFEEDIISQSLRGRHCFLFEEKDDEK